MKLKKNYLSIECTLLICSSIRTSCLYNQIWCRPICGSWITPFSTKSVSFVMILIMVTIHYKPSCLWPFPPLTLSNNVFKDSTSFINAYIVRPHFFWGINMVKKSQYVWLCQGFISHTPARVRDGSLPEGLNEYPTQLPRLRQLWTHIGSKSLVMQDCKQLPRLITAPEYFGNLQREMSQVATWTFNVLYCFPFIWFIGSHYPRSYI